MTLPKIPVAMAERVEVVIDFGACPVGAEVILQNLSDSDISGRVSDEIMRFDVARSEEDDSAIPARLSDMRPVPGHAAMRTRRFVFAGGPELRFPPVTHWTINGSDFQVDRPVATPRYGDVEIWHFENRKRLGFLGLVHPVHVHLVNFQVIERDGGPPPPHETGWKDTVAITSSTRTTR
jgi:spore coat protein A